MYQRRFQNIKSKPLFNIKGRFKVSYLGRGIFYYTIPGKKYPIVGKLDLSVRKIRHHFIVACTLLVIVSMYSSFFSRTQAGPVINEDDLERLEKQGRIDELEKQSEEAKQRLYSAENPMDSIGTPSHIKVMKYQIKKGETITSIAKRHKMDEKYIYITSKLNSSSTIKPGQEISIPERPGIFYKVKSGENLASILERYKVKSNEMQADNPNLASMDFIEPGLNIFLPNAKIPNPNLSWLPPALGRLTSSFGFRRHPIMRIGHFHTGLDIAVSYKPIKAARPGTVVYAGYLGAYGKVVMLRHNDSFKTLYGHLSNIKVKPGDQVGMGKVIAISGSTGRSTGPHLHFEVVKNGRPVNPCGYGYSCPRGKRTNKAYRRFSSIKKKSKSLIQ